jgi:hypothetical protein
MNGCRAAGITRAPPVRRAAMVASSRSQITLILLHIFVTADAVYEVLTIFRKDCGQHRLNSVFRLTRGPKPALVQSSHLQRRADPPGRENGHVFKGRTQTA